MGYRRKMSVDMLPPNDGSELASLMKELGRKANGKDGDYMMPGSSLLTPASYLIQPTEYFI